MYANQCRFRGEEKDAYAGQLHRQSNVGNKISHANAERVRDFQ
jgi:hypothetical protein